MPRFLRSLEIWVARGVTLGTSADVAQSPLTGVASTPILVKPAEVGVLHPPGDFRGSSDYRRHLAGILTQRVVDQLEGQA